MTKPSRITVEKTYMAGMFGVAVVQIGSMTADLIPSTLALLAQYNLVPMPLQVDALGTALCNAGAGTIIQYGIYLLALVLFVKFFPDVKNVFDAKGSKSSGAQQQSGMHSQNAAMKIGGIVILGALPNILATMGFSLLSCIEALTLFS